MNKKKEVTIPDLDKIELYMNNNETIKTAELVNSYLPQITVSQTFSVMNTNNDTVVTLDEFFNTLNVLVRSSMHEESASEMLINLSKLESKLTNTSLDIEMNLPELKDAAQPVYSLCFF